MNDKKHIDRIFQEKFKDFEVSPSPNVWNGIQDKLNHPEKDRKRIFPFWLRFAGVAALLLLMFTVGNLMLNNTSKNKTNTKVVGTEKTIPDRINTSTDTEFKTSISTSKNSTNNLETNSNSQLEDNINSSIEFTNNSQIASENNSKSLNNKKTPIKRSITKQLEKKSSINKSNSNTNPVVFNKNESKNTDPKNNLNLNTSYVEFEKNNINENSNRITDNQNKTKNNVSNSKTEMDPSRTEEQLQNKTTGIAVNDTNRTDIENTLEKNNVESRLEIDAEKANNQLENRATDNNLAEEKNTEAKLEEKETNAEELNKTNLTIEEAIAANKDIIEKEEELINRWQVYANIAPVYYNSMGKGSQIDEQFVNNSKTGEVNTSYGVNVSYNLNKKLSIRTGLSSLNLSYDTNDVILYENIASSNSTSNPLKNINLSSGNETLTALSADNLGVGQVDNSLSPQSNAAISQRISYYEVPVELNYRIGNKKLGLNIIAGFSSFILDGNEVYSELKDEKTYIGEANNIKSLSFSTNLGVGLDYKFSEKVKFNLEPTFKYQLNAFENTSGNFNPYIIGVYTGFSYKF